MAEELTPEAVELVENHYGHVVRAQLPARMAAPKMVLALAEPELVDAFEQSAISFGIDPSTIDWVTVIPEIITAIMSGNVLAIVRLGLKYGLPLLKMIRALIEQFHKPATPTPGGGPAINPA